MIQFLPVDYDNGLFHKKYILKVPEETVENDSNNKTVHQRNLLAIYKRKTLTTDN